MPTLQTTTPVSGLTSLTSGVNFTGLAVLAPGPGMDRVGCCEFAEECLILQLSDGQLTAASLYRDGSPTASGLLDVALPFTLPSTTGDQYYRLGYLAGSVEDRLANLPVQRCKDCFSYELTIPDQVSLEIAEFPANSQIAGTAEATRNSLETQVNTLTRDLTNVQTQNTNLHAQNAALQTSLDSANTNLTDAQTSLTTAQTDLTTANSTIAALNTQLAALQAQIDALNQADQDTTAATNAANAVRSAIAALTLRDLSTCTTTSTTASSTAGAESTTSASTQQTNQQAINETTQALTNGGSGKVVPLRPSIVKAGCEPDSSIQSGQISSTPGNGSGSNGSTSTTAANILAPGGKVVNLNARINGVIPGCAPQKSPDSIGCCTPNSKSTTQSSTSQSDQKTTSAAIASALANAERFAPAIKAGDLCAMIEEEKKKLLVVQPGCSEPQTISDQSSCTDADC